MAAEQKQNTLCELVDGVLVEKGTGYSESLLAGTLIEILRRFVKPRKLGLVSAPDGMVRLFPGLIRIPDVAFASWDRFPDRKVPNSPVPAIVPDLVIELLSESNTPAEMERKRAEYFAAGVRLIWEVDPPPRIVRVLFAVWRGRVAGRVADARWWRRTAGVYLGPERVIRGAGRARLIK